MSDLIKDIRTQIDEQRENEKIEVHVECNFDKLLKTVLPFTLGYAGNTHGLVQIEMLSDPYVLRLKRLA